MANERLTSTREYVTFAFPPAVNVALDANVRAIIAPAMIPTLRLASSTRSLRSKVWTIRNVTAPISPNRV